MSRTVVVTGAGGFIGRHVVEVLRADESVITVPLARDTTPAEFAIAIASADVVVHCAGVNRPDRLDEFEAGNVALTRKIAGAAARGGRTPTVILASSLHAGADSPYGASKAAAEAVLRTAAGEGALRAVVLRLPGVFGKWSRPDYNSVVATFCHRLARGLPIAVDDPESPLVLLYIDEVTALIGRVVGDSRPAADFLLIDKFPGAVTTTVGEVASLLTGFSECRAGGTLPDVGNRFVRQLWSTWLSFLPDDQFAYSLIQRADARGVLAEIFRSEGAGQLFVSRTLPGVVRGEHWHHSKAEKFVVVEGHAVVRFRPVHGDHVVEYPVCGDDFSVIDIPPGWVHHIENVGDGTLVVLFWASEPFDPARPDTIPAEVRRGTT